jgi:hypothetical protein
VTSSAAVLEARDTIEKLFYAELPKGRYANMHKDNLEFHLNMDAIKQVKFETGESKRGNFTTYAIRFLDEKEEPALSAFLQWGKPGEYAPGTGRSLAGAAGAIRRSLATRTSRIEVTKRI